MMRIRLTLLLLPVLLCASLAANAAESELQTVLARMLAGHIHPAPGFRARILVPPGSLYDPLVMQPMGDKVWLNDDGKEAEGADGEQKGSRLLAVDHAGKVSVLVDADKMAPISAGFDIAPAGFGAYGGQVFALSQPKTGDQGGRENYILQRIDPKAGFAVSRFCTLPATGAKETAGIGVDARFGPPGSAFAGKLYASTTLNNMIYQVTPDGRCEPFVHFDPDKQGGPLYMRFTPDGKLLLVTVVRGGIFAAHGSAILAVHADGNIDDKPIAEAPTMFGSLDFAPAGFGRYGGQIFVVEVGSYEIPVPAGRPLRADGKLHRVTPEGKLELVASGFINPWNVRFVGNTLWVSDINGDFIYGHRELPDGFIVVVTPK